MPIYWVETTSSHRMCYAIKADRKPDNTDILRLLGYGNIGDVAQEWKGETVDSIREVTPDEYIQLLDNEYNGESIAGWNQDQKMSLINIIEENNPSEDSSQEEDTTV